MEFSVRWDQRKFDQVAKRIASAGEKGVKALESVMFEEAERIIAKAKDLTPVDTGALRASGHVQLPERNGGQISVLLGFGGPAGSGNQGGSNPKDVGYAVYVHENLEVHHPVGGAKFLEHAAIDQLRDFPQRAAVELNLALQGP